MITIPPAVYSSLKKKIQKDALAILAEHEKKMRLKDIMDASITKLNGSRLSDNLLILFYLGLVRISVENGVTLYQAVAPADVQNVHSNIQNVHGDIQNVHENPTTLTLTEHELTNKQDFEISKDTQAEGETSPVATERVTAPSGVPGGAGEAVAVVSAAPAPISPPPEKRETLFRVIKNENVIGEIFFSENPLDGHLVMLQNLEDKPGAYEAFAKYILVLWNLHQQFYGGGRTVNDFVLWRAAYIFAMQDYEKTKDFFDSPQAFMRAALRDKGKGSLYKKMVGMVGDYFVSRGWGWDVTPIPNRVTYAFELDRFHRHGGRVRKELFPSYCNDRGWTLPGVVKDSPVPPVAEDEAWRIEHRRELFLKDVEKVERMSESAREIYFEKLPKDHLKLYQTNMPPDLWERYIALRPQRKEVMLMK